MNITYILFDADGTLFDYEHAELQAFKNTLKEFRIEGNTNDLHSSYKKINYAIWKDFEDHKISAQELRSERFRRFLAQEDLCHDHYKMSDAYISHLAQGTALLEDAIGVVDYLKKKYSVSIITNGLANVQYSRIRKSALNNAFDHIFISEEIGYPKPMKEIFEYVFVKIGNPEKDEVMIIGDSFRSDIMGGINFGIKTCWFNPKKIENESGILPDYEIQKLADILSIL